MCLGVGNVLLCELDVILDFWTLFCNFCGLECCKQRNIHVCLSCGNNSQLIDLGGSSVFLSFALSNCSMPIVLDSGMVWVHFHVQVGLI